MNIRIKPKEESVGRDCGQDKKMGERMLIKGRNWALLTPYGLTKKMGIATQIKNGMS